jgi:hypothetical protein
MAVEAQRYTPSSDEQKVTIPPVRSDRRPRRAAVPYLRLVGSLLFFGLGAWYAVSGEARFQLGGDDLSNRKAIHVNAHGMDAVAIGCVFVAAGLVNLALGLRGPARLRVFWAGVALLGAAVLYGLVNVL